MVQRDTAHFLKRDCRAGEAYAWFGHELPTHLRTARFLFSCIALAFSLSPPLSLSLPFVRVYPLCKRWRPTRRALDMATPAERFKSSVRVIRPIDPSFCAQCRDPSSFMEIYDGDFCKIWRLASYEIRLWIRTMDDFMVDAVIPVFRYESVKVSYRWKWESVKAENLKTYGYRL